MQILKEEIRERILQAALDDFYESGFAAASTRKIIRAAKISNGNLYNYFQSKEELFDAIAAPFCSYLRRFMQGVFDGDSPEDFGDERTASVSEKIAKMLEEHRKEFIVVLEGSKGTKYENFKSDMIDAMAEHYRRNIRKDFQSPGIGEGFIMRIIAINFVEGLIGIARSYRNAGWAGENVRLLLQYHSRGIAQFY